MVKRIKKTALLALTVCMMLVSAIASAEDTPEIYESAFQLGFITPFGTNGRFSHQSMQYP